MARRWLYEPPAEAVDGPRVSPAELAAECRRLYAEITELGGATVDTTLPFCGPHPLAARTVVQPDGDVICMVHPYLLADADLRRTHQHRVEERMGQLRGAVGQVSAVARTASVAAGAVVATVSGSVAWAVGNASASLLALALSMTVVPVAREGAKAALRWKLRRVLH